MTRSSREVVLALRRIVPIINPGIKFMGQSEAALAAVALSAFSLMRRKYVESSAPEMLCQTLNNALGTAASGEKRAWPVPCFK
jgi:hypothetical protein